MDQVNVVTLGLLLFVVCVVAIITRRIGSPCTIGLVVAGIALSLIGYRSRIVLTPELIFTVLLPPLVFEEALHLKWRHLRERAPLVLALPSSECWRRRRSSVFGGLLCGVVVAGLLPLLARGSDDHLVELTLTVLAAHGSFLLAGNLGASGVLATLAAGSPTLRRHLLHYVQAMMVQLSRSIAAGQPIEQRLARWLLMCHDRVAGEVRGIAEWSRVAATASTS